MEGKELERENKIEKKKNLSVGIDNFETMIKKE